MRANANARKAIVPLNLCRYAPNYCKLIVPIMSEQAQKMIDVLGQDSCRQLPFKTSGNDFDN